MMKLPFSLFLAIKYLRPKRSMVSVITLLTMGGIMLGVAILIAVLAVMTGFDDQHKAHMIKLDSHVQISAQGQRAFPPAPVLEALQEVPGVVAAAPAIEDFVLITHRDEMIPAALRGIDPERERSISDIESYLVAGTLPTNDETVVVGNRLAASLHIFVGDTLTVASSASLANVDEGEIRLPVELTVCGIFSVGMYDVDSKFLISSLPTARDVFALERGVRSLRVITDDPFAAEETSERIAELFRRKSESDPRLGWLRLLDAQSWMRIHESLLGTLMIEKNMMFLLFCFIFVVAAFSITNSLITLCVQKTHEIGLLKSLGFSSGKIVGVFFLLGAIQGGWGCLLGVGLGALIANNLNPILDFARNFNPNLMSAQFYQFSEMPSRVTLEDVLIVCGMALVFSTLAGILPALRAARMEPVDALRYE